MLPGIPASPNEPAPCADDQRTMDHRIAMDVKPLLCTETAQKLNRQMPWPSIAMHRTRLGRAADLWREKARGAGA
jgi:hypothetical protein